MIGYINNHSLSNNNDVQLPPADEIPNQSVLSYNSDKRVWTYSAAGNFGMSTKNLVIAVEDWKDSGSSYTIDIPRERHGQGNQVFIKTFEGVTSLTEVFTGWSSDLEGNLTLTVSKNPDGRFAGILSVNRLLIV
jgi:hypothetical protein